MINQLTHTFHKLTYTYTPLKILTYDSTMLNNHCFII